MRNIGGSVGIAIATTLISRRAQQNVNVLGTHVTPYDTSARLMLDGLKNAMIARGADVVTATERANALVAGLVSRQANMLAFVGVFRLLAIIFLLMLPLLLLMSSPRHRRTDVAAH